MRRRTGFKKAIGVLTFVMALTLPLAGFVYPNPPPGPASTAGTGAVQDFPDPGMAAWRQEGSSNAYLFASQTGPNNSLIPFWTHDVLSGAEGAYGLRQALTAEPEGASFVDAPSAAVIDGTWVMWFTSYRPGSPNCLQVAHSGVPIGSGSFTVTGIACNTNLGFASTVGLFDPSIWVNPDGSPWLLFAAEDGGQLGNQGLYSTPLSGTGDLAGAPIYKLADFQTVNAQEQNVGTNPGSSTPVIENPQFQIDPQPYTDGMGRYIPFDLLMSYGVFNHPGSYHTLEIGCTSITGPCDDYAPTLLDSYLVGSAAVDNPGAAATLTEGAYSPSYTTFAGTTPNNPPGEPRQTYVETNTAPRSPEVGSPVLANNATLTSGQSVYNFVNGYTLVMQSDGNLNLVNQRAVSAWSTRTNGNPGARAVVQGDGNFVVYSSSNAVLFNTNTQNNPNAFLILQQDDNLVLESQGGRVLYSSNTCLNCSNFTP